MNIRFAVGVSVLALLFLATRLPAAGLLDSVRGLTGTNAPKAAGSLASLSTEEVTKGLREALAKGAQNAVANLGKEDGFLKNLDAKIPLPELIKNVESAARLSGRQKLVDDFVVSMNRAAEKAVPEGLSILADRIARMSMADAKKILNGPPDAATQYFRHTSTNALTEKFRPIVAKATDSVGVTQRYKDLTGTLGGAQSLGGLFGGKVVKAPESFDLDGYVTSKALEGLFKMLAAEEKAIRTNPAARTTDLLRKVFGAQ